MSSINAHRDEFMRLLNMGDENKCIEYINEYDDFYDTTYRTRYYGSVEEQNMLMHACDHRLSRVAKALIDKKCNLTYQDKSGYTALMTASTNNLCDVVTYIIDKLPDTTTRCLTYGHQYSEMMSLCCYSENNNNDANVIKMIDRGYDIYYMTYHNQTLFRTAIEYKLENIVTKLIDKDDDFISQFKQYYDIQWWTEDGFYYNIAKYCTNKRDGVKREIIATMNDASPANMLYQSFHTTYAVQLVDIICDFILLPI
ncbi:MAG: hypothetical protein Faunusvirus13_10 [Faunusvirus sp.]|uniref:Uncharacterized protein n=1 Tax=Faunusvirus sp. TaxID=2487766 RepID=A0A3G4ZWY7_9VIRU|nr:MAG: hypothetical protein Faunusvirus13_10 [Faunusvirus sp.]